MSEDDVFRFLTAVAALTYAGGVAALTLALTPRLADRRSA